jgi:pyruvate dehydrogenase E1 component
MWQVAMEARSMLAADWGVSADAWSVTSYSELREDALSVERANRLHPEAEHRVAYVTEALGQGAGPVVAVTDYLRAVPDQVARWVPRRFVSLGTDGFGRSDTRAALRRFFEVDAAHVVVAVLSTLAETGDAKRDEVADAITRYGIDADSADPWTA